MNFDKGDKAFVLGKGYGKVSTVLPDGSFEVKIENYGYMHFTRDGAAGGSGLKRVFYDDPVIVEPVRNEYLWAAYKRLAKALFDELTGLAAVGQLPEIPD
ncbi:MAG: hypothetical protein LBQ12_14145 [Deltaproteobacteria bacterium]|jgi:translation initiation factor IF-1|nr:hypothetical protein [Deltaproteobacteria bacterium]